MLHFGQAVLNVDAREVTLRGDPQHLEPQAFDLLVYLVEHRDRVVPKTELLDEIWGDQFVSESALTTRVKEVRRALGDDGRTQAVIKNVRGRGYRFVAGLQAATASGAGSSPTRSLSALPNASLLTGRDGEVVQLIGAVDESKLVTLVGPGGVGKTALAIHAAHGLGNRFSDGIAFVDLASITDGDSMPNAVRHATGFGAPGMSDRQAIEAIAALDILLILDNCEHVIAAAADFVQSLRRANPEFRVLATSRERLNISEEHVANVKPLVPEAGRQLFVERARRSQPGVELQPDDPAIGEILIAVDSLPLAIEMAAGRLTTMGIAELQALLQVAPDVLRSSTRDAVPRHRSLTDVVAWSVALLPMSAREFFGPLSVFAGPANIEDIVGVLSVDGADRLRIVDAVTALVESSLLTVDFGPPTPTYRLLETVKSHARTLERPASLERKHAEWFAGVADAADRDLRTSRERSGNDRLASVFAELRAAHRWARQNDHDLACRITGALDLYTHGRLLSEPAAWAADLYGRIGQDHPLGSLVAAALAADAAHRSDIDAARRFAAEALGGPKDRAEVSALETLADVAIYVGDLSAAMLHAEQLRHLGAASADHQAHTSGVVGMALALAYGGAPAHGLDELRTAASSTVLSPSAQAWLKYGEAECLVGDEPAVAQELYFDAIELAESVGASFVASVSRVSLAAALARHGDVHDAAARFRENLRSFERDGNLTHAVTSMRNLVELFVHVGLDEPAMVLLGALSAPEMKATYGAEQEALETSRSVSESRSGAAEVGAWLQEGDGRDIRWALHHAARVLDDLSSS